jgi:hypothetical protein
MKIRHSLEFETEFIGEYAETIISRYSEEQINHILVSMLHDLVVPRLQPTLDEINENGSWAILRVVK